MPQEKDLSTLRSAMNNSRKELAPFRLKAEEAVREYVGVHYGKGEGTRSPVNVTELAINVYMQNLASGIPQVLVSTAHRTLKPSAKSLELALNFLAIDLEVQERIRRSVLSAMFAPFSIMKVAKQEAGVVDSPEGETTYSRPFCLEINFDDWVHDMSANRWDDVSFMGHRYRMPLEEARNNEAWDEEARGELSATSRINRGDEDSGGRRLEDLPRGYSGEYDDYEDLVEIWEMYLPRDGVILSFPADGSGSYHRPLEVRQWEGREHGPYIRLEFGEVPNTMMGLPPVYAWMDLHGAINDVYGRLITEAKASKRLIGYTGTAADDASRMRRIDNLTFFRMDHPGEVQPMTVGGVDSMNLAFTMNMLEQFNRQVGNLDTLGGLAIGAPTLGQEQLLSGTSSKRVQFMQQRVLNYVTEIFKAIAFNIWKDPTISIPLAKKVKSRSGERDQTLPFNYTSEKQEGDYLQYNISIEPYSLVHRTPQEKAQMMMQLLNQAVPHLPMMQQQGMSINYPQYYRRLAQLMNIEGEVDNLFAFSSAPTNQPVGESVRQAPVTERHSVRHNSGGGQNGAGGGGSAQMLQAMMAQGGGQE